MKLEELGSVRLDVELASTASEPSELRVAGYLLTRPHVGDHGFVPQFRVDVRELEAHRARLLRDI